MKLFIVTCLKDFQEDVTKILKAASIHVFSATDVTGFKDNQSMNLMEDWFASGDEKFDSLFVFSFTTDESALLGLELIKKYNEETATQFPVRAFIVPVENASF